MLKSHSAHGLACCTTTRAAQSVAWRRAHIPAGTAVPNNHCVGGNCLRPLYGFAEGRRITRASSCASCLRAPKVPPQTHGTGLRIVSSARASSPGLVLHSAGWSRAGTPTGGGLLISGRQSGGGGFVVGLGYANPISFTMRNSSASRLHPASALPVGQWSPTVPGSHRRRPSSRFPGRPSSRRYPGGLTTDFSQTARTGYHAALHRACWVSWDAPRSPVAGARTN